MYLNYNKLESDCQDFQSKILKSEQRKKLQTEVSEILTQAVLKHKENNINYNSHKMQIEETIMNCADFLCVNPSTGKLTGANFCKNRLCPVCSYNKSVQCFAETMKIINYLEPKKYKYIFATVTLSNTPDIVQGVQDCLHGFMEMQHQRKFRKAFEGVIRTLEITLNPDTKEFHPHIHMICAVTVDYFTDDKKYISQEELCRMWKTACKIDYTPVCDIRLIRGTEKAVAETSKYAVKPLEVAYESDRKNAYTEIYKATYNRRLRSMTGCFNKANKELCANSPPLTDDEKKNAYHQFLRYNYLTEQYENYN